MSARPWNTAFVGWCVGLTAFQVALAAGAPWGAAAWGGRHGGVLPPQLRAASGAAALGVAGVAAVAAGQLGGPVAQRRVLLGTAAYSALGIVANAASPSPIERAIGVPMSISGGALAIQAYRHLGAAVRA